MILSFVNFTGGAVAHSFAPQLIAFATNEFTLKFVASVGLGIISHWLYDLLKGRKSGRALCGAKASKVSGTRGASPNTPVHSSTIKPIEKL